MFKCLYVCIFRDHSALFKSIRLFKIILMKEEEIRGKLLLPFLNDLGFDLSEISLEESFTIRLGKSQRAITGRSDILCRRNGKNLFIIELKNDSISITQSDIEQGISYARSLVDDIAPFTIITNGKTTRIFDSVSKSELTGKKISDESIFWKNDYTLSTDVELRIRYEALKNFVSFSSENLRIFCENQVRDRMGPIVGTITTPASKFVEELYFQRQDLLTVFNNFIDSEAKIFGIVGAAGVGKTNVMCSLAIQNLENNFVFFYNAAIINKSPLEHISQDLNGVFSSKSESDLILKKLDELGRFLNKSVLIFIDAIDESTNPNLSLELSEIALACRNLRKVKICVSCKSNIWNSILKVKGINTHLFEELSKFHSPIVDLNNNPGFLLQEFNDDEIKDITLLYKSSFDFKGELSKSLLIELRNGFFLRIFSEVYNHKQVPDKINDKELIKRYIKESLDRTELRFQSSIRILAEIGRILMNYNYSLQEKYEDDGLDVNNLLEKLNFAMDENLPEDLFSRNILIKSNKEDSYNVNFYYSKIRDYIICFHTYRLDQLNDLDFYNILDRFYENYIGQSAIDFYIENASNSHKCTLIKFKEDKALQYVNNYDSYLEKNFKNFKKLFDPKTEGNIGIILPKDLLNDEGYALFHLESNSSKKIRFENLKDPFSDLNRDDFLKIGVNAVYGSYISFLITDQSKVIKQNLFKQLKEIVKKNKLMTYDSDILLLEKVSLILYYYHQKMGYDSKLHDYYIPRFDLIYPIDLNELRNRLYQIRAFYHYKNRHSLSSPQLEHKVKEAFISNIDIPELCFGGDISIIEKLFKIVSILLERGYNHLENHHLPYPDKSVIEAKEYYNQNKAQNLNKVRVFQYSEDQAKLYIKTFFTHLECAYKKFIDHFFPTFKGELLFYKNMPHEYFFYMRDSDILKWGMFGYRPSKSGELSIHINDQDKDREAFEKENISVLRPFSLDVILINDGRDKVQIIPNMNVSKADDFCVIRNWVYKILTYDLDKLFKENIN